MTTNLTGTPMQGDQLRIDFTDDGTARAITWGASFEAGAAPLPTTTAISTRLDTVFFWNTVTSKWRCMASSSPAIAITTDVLKGDNAGNAVALGTATSGKIVQSNGTLAGYSTATWPTTNGYGDVVMGDGTNWVASPIGKTTVTSTVDQTATAEQAHVVFTVPANSARVGTTYHIMAWGNTDSGTSITMTPRLRWGGTAGVLLVTGPVPTVGSAITGKDWKADCYTTIRTTGATGTATAVLALENHVNTTYQSDELSSGATAVTIDTTANKDLDLTWTLSATTGTPHIRTFGGTIEIIK